MDKTPRRKACERRLITAGIRLRSQATRRKPVWGNLVFMLVIFPCFRIYVARTSS